MSQILPFPDKISDFHPPKLTKIIRLFPPYFHKFPPVFKKFITFLHALCVISPPYFDHDAFMHHPMHVLDASANVTTPQGG